MMSLQNFLGYSAEIAIIDFLAECDPNLIIISGAQ